MSIIYVLIIISLVMALFFLGAFLWAVKSGQFNDSYSPSVRMLMDDGSIKEEDETSKSNTN